MVKLAKLKELHKRAKEHPYRTDKIGTPKSYAMVLEKLAEEFLEVLKKQLPHGSIPPYPFPRKENKYTGFIWAHQYWSNLLALKMPYKDFSEHLAMLEFYLNMIHAFIEAGELKFIYIDLGYTKGGNKDYVFNPKRIYKIIYYSDREEWNFDRESAELRLPIVKEWLKKAKKELENHDNEYGKSGKSEKEARWRQYILDKIARHKKRIADLKAIIKLNVVF